MITRNAYTQGKGELAWDTWPNCLVLTLSLQSENETNSPLKSGPAKAGPAGPATPPLPPMRQCKTQLESCAAISACPVWPRGEVWHSRDQVTRPSSVSIVSLWLVVPPTGVNSQFVALLPPIWWQ